MSIPLSLENVSAVMRLVREVCDRWDEPRAWREHLLLGACALLKGHVGMMVADAQATGETFGKPRVVAAVGVSAPMRPLVAPALARWEALGYEDASRDLMPGMARLNAEMGRQGWVTAARREIADDKAYYAAPHYREFRRRLDCDDYVVSIRLVDVPRRPEAINVDRPHGAERFGEREVMLLKLLHDEIAPLIGVRLTTEEHLSREGLSARLRQTLALLLEGMSEKEAAAQLGLSRRTVHDYVTMLYGHFRVSSRPELLAYFIRRRPARRE